jgi:hypothetical protein
MTNLSAHDAWDQAHRRCPRLGGPVSFSYCRKSGEDSGPCWKIISCWWEIFDVVSYLKETMDSSSFSALTQASPKSKIESLVELIIKTKKNIQSGGKNDSEEQ